MARGGKRAGAGRPPGARSKATAEAKQALEALARSHTKTALKALVEVAEAAESDAARVSAAVALLDRGYGRPHQTQDTNVTMGAGEAFVNLLRVVNEHRRSKSNGTVANGVDHEAKRPAGVRH